jgi:hypothetical protein
MPMILSDHGYDIIFQAGDEVSHTETPNIWGSIQSVDLDREVAVVQWDKPRVVSANVPSFSNPPEEVPLVRLIPGDEAWWRCAEGETVHYHHGHDTWLRGEVHDSHFYPKALLGAVNPYELPRLRDDGTVVRSHLAKRVLEGKHFDPSLSNIWEASDILQGMIVGAGRPDPTTLEAIPLDDPEPTPRQRELIAEIKACRDKVDAMKLELQLLCDQFYDEESNA